MHASPTAGLTTALSRNIKTDLRQNIFEHNPNVPISPPSVGMIQNNRLTESMSTLQVDLNSPKIKDDLSSGVSPVHFGFTLKKRDAATIDEYQDSDIAELEALGGF